MELISNYMTDDSSRKMLNELTQKTFGFDFEGWVQGGYFEGDYIPYSLTEGGRMLANVSANKMHFMQRGTKKNYIQIGTVMTDEDYRMRGLGRKLMEHVISRLAPEDNKLRLGFTPLEEDMYLCTSEIYDGADDYRLFYRGDALLQVEKDKLYFPELSHA